MERAPARRAVLAGAAAAVALAAFLALGALVSHAPPGALDRSAGALAGKGASVALVLTGLGLFPVYAVLCVLVLALGVVRRALLAEAVAAVLSLIIIWKISDLAKDYFARPRPTHWILRHETSFSYPSGHAVLSLTFYGFWAAVAWNSALASGPKWALVVFFLALTAAIGWSRLALGAHFPTDLIGGYILGAGTVVVTRLALAGVRRARGRAVV